MSPPIWVISIVTLLIALLITTHDPQSSVADAGAADAASGRRRGFGVLA